jgi:hypothetical protein
LKVEKIPHLTNNLSKISLVGLVCIGAPAKGVQGDILHYRDHVCKNNHRLSSCLESMASLIQSGGIGKGNMDEMADLLWGWWYGHPWKNEIRIDSKEFEQIGTKTLNG